MMRLYLNKIGQTILTLCLLISTLHNANANMAQPKYLEQFKAIPANPFISEYVDIINEELNIEVQANFKNAAYQIKYHISSTKSGIQIPLLFIANDYSSDFRVSLDGIEIPLLSLPEGLEGSKLHDFRQIFGESKHSASVVLEELDFYASLQNMLYFEVELTEGTHLIEVTYIANVFVSQQNLIKEYSFRYALSPALYWRSFGSLDLTIDLTAVKHLSPNIDVNIDQSQDQNNQDIQKWHFDDMPVPILKITYNPTVNRLSSLLVRLGVQGFTYILGFGMFFLHIFSLYRFQSQAQTKTTSIIRAASVILIPFFIALSGFFYFWLVSLSLGEHAGKLFGAGYFFIAMTYPVLLVGYGVIIWVVTKIMKSVK